MWDNKVTSPHPEIGWGLYPPVFCRKNRFTFTVRSTENITHPQPKRTTTMKYCSNFQAYLDSTLNSGNREEAIKGLNAMGISTNSWDVEKAF